MLYIAPAERQEAAWLAPRLRECDKQEVYAATGKSPVAVLPLSYDLSVECFTLRGKRGGDPIGIFGVGSGGRKTSVGHIGVPWLLGTDELVNDHGLSFLRISRLWVERLARPFDILANLVYAHNHVHIRWLQWAGFSLNTRAQPHGPFDAPFIPFVYTPRRYPS
jgi:hypothetical protein